MQTTNDLARAFHTRATRLAGEYKASAERRLVVDTHMHDLAVRGGAGDPLPSGEQIAAIVDSFVSTLDNVAVLTVGALCDVLVERAKTFAAAHVAAAPGSPTQAQLEAVVVGVVNYIAGQHGVDLALYARDIGVPNLSKAL